MKKPDYMWNKNGITNRDYSHKMLAEDLEDFYLSAAVQDSTEKGGLIEKIPFPNHYSLGSLLYGKHKRRYDDAVSAHQEFRKALSEDSDSDKINYHFGEAIDRWETFRLSSRSPKFSELEDNRNRLEQTVFNACFGELKKWIGKFETVLEMLSKRGFSEMEYNTAILEQFKDYFEKQKQALYCHVRHIYQHSSNIGNPGQHVVEFMVNLYRAYDHPRFKELVKTATRGSGIYRRIKGRIYTRQLVRTHDLDYPFTVQNLDILMQDKPLPLSFPALEIFNTSSPVLAHTRKPYSKTEKDLIREFNEEISSRENQLHEHLAPLLESLGTITTESGREESDNGTPSEDTPATETSKGRARFGPFE